MNWKVFGIIYCIFAIYPLLLFVFDILDRIKYKDYMYVRFWFGVDIACMICTLGPALGFISNGLYMYYDKSTENNMWFVVMMATGYLCASIIFTGVCKEKIIYSLDDNKIFVSNIFYKNRIVVEDITRINLSDKTLDIYIGDRRVRYGADYLVGAEEFEIYIKRYHLNKGISG